MAYFDILILALIAGFILLRLRSVLGQDFGQDGNPPGYGRRHDDSPVIKLPEHARLPREEKAGRDEQLEAIPDASIRTGLNAIREADPTFTVEHFVTGARAAFEMVFDAFARGDRETLAMLLSPALMDTFAKEIERRSTEDRHADTTLLAVISADIISASLVKQTALVKVRFVSEQVSVTRDKGGAIVEGDPSASQHVEDEWTFEREANSRNPNWKIIET